VLWPETIPEEDILNGPDKDAIEYLNRVIPQIGAECRKYNLYFICAFESYLKRFSYNSEDSNKSKKDSTDVEEVKSQFKEGCLFPWENLHLEPDGYVYPECKCMRSIGDLRKNSLREIWNGETMQLYRRLIKNGKAEEICSEQCKLYNSLERHVRAD
jgi:MoaA/NifB/PqqE/SkfB family radical SAM enzyme